MKKDIFQLVDECVLTKRMNEVSKQIEENEYEKKLEYRRESYQILFQVMLMFIGLLILAFIYLKFN